MFSGRPQEKDLYGTWKILRCESLDNPHESLVGTEFRLEEGGELTWTLSPGALEEGLPFFGCETYEIEDLGSCSESSVLKLYGPSVDRIKFRCQYDISQGGKLVLRYDHYLKLVCDKVTLGDCPDIPCPVYSLSNALQEGFFSDATITVKNGRKFAIHKAVITCSLPDQKWTSILLQLSELSPEVLQALLHYFYNSCLPKGLTEDTANGLLTVARKMKLIRLAELCKEYIDSTAVRSRINTLLSELRHTMDHTIILISGIKCHTYDDSAGQETCPIDPAKLCDAIKVTIKEMATGALKFILLCEIFNKRKTEVTREERHAIIQSVKDSLPGFAEQVHTFLVKCHECLASLKETHKKEIADSLIPEIEMAWEKANSVGNEANSAMEKIVNLADGEHRKRNHKMTVGKGLSRILRNAIHMKELMALKKLHGEATSSFVFLQQKRETYACMPKNEKIRIIVRAVDKMRAEIPDHISTVEKFPAAMRERLTWKDWKHLFTGGTARVAWLLGKIRKHKEILKPLIQIASDLVSQEAFTQTAAELSLMDSLPSPTGEAAAAAASLQPQTVSSSMDELTRKHDSLHLNSATTPPPAAESALAKALGSLLASGEYTDMKFVVGGSGSGGEQGPDGTTTGQTVELRAHRVVVASRCDWFRRALLSGMKESIDRKISIPDVNPELFGLFLRYLYCGVLDTESMTLDRLMEMLALADKYETDVLKQMCEISLYKQHISEDSVLELLCFADQYSASTLKRGTFNFLEAHPDLCDSELFGELPHHLQLEVMEQIHPRANSRECDSAAEEFASCALSDDEESKMCTFSNRERLENCIKELQEILGDSIPRPELVRMTIAADYDVNRAINFYFSSYH